MREILKRFLEPATPPQSGVIRGQYYERSGSCHQCGQCCTNIHLVHGDQPITSRTQFEALQRDCPEYASFEPIDEEADGTLIFHCHHLQPDNSCGIYEQRPDFCRRYPSEEGLLLGGKLAADCGYRFRLLKNFQAVLNDLH